MHTQFHLYKSPVLRRCKLQQSCMISLFFVYTQPKLVEIDLDLIRFKSNPNYFVQWKRCYRFSFAAVYIYDVKIHQAPLGKKINKMHSIFKIEGNTHTYMFIWPMLIDRACHKKSFLNMPPIGQGFNPLTRLSNQFPLLPNWFQFRQ